MTNDEAIYRNFSASGTDFNLRTSNMSRYYCAVLGRVQSMSLRSEGSSELDLVSFLLAFCNSNK